MSREQQPKPNASANIDAPIQAKQVADAQRQGGAPSARQQSLGELGSVIQRRAAGAAEQSDDAQGTAREGVAGAGQEMPHAGQIQQAFGKHDISGVKAHVGGRAGAAAGALGAQAYATGNKVAFAAQPDVHTAAHEAAHAVQQGAGKVSAKGLTAGNDKHEQQADKVADKVVAGQSAEPLLDQMTGAAGPGVAPASAGDAPGPAAAAPGVAADTAPAAANAAAPAPSAGAAPAAGEIVQRKLVDDVKGPALAAIARPLPASPHTGSNPEPGWEFFSGPKQASVVHKPNGEYGDGLGRAIEELGIPSHGTPQSFYENAVPERYPEIMSRRAFELAMGSSSSNEYTDSPLPLKSYFHHVLYPTDPGGGPWTMNMSTSYKRRADSDKFQTWMGSGIGISTLAGTVTGSQQLETPSDGELFGRWTSKIVPKPFDQIIGDTTETRGFVDALKPTGVTGLTAWYKQGRSGIFGGKGARGWIDATYQNDELQKNTLRSLQLLHRQGVSQANEDMDEIVDAMRTIIHDKKTDSTKRVVMENRILDSGVAANVKVDNAAVPDDADKKPDTADANFDRMRIAGKVIARRELVPFLEHTFDPVVFAKIYPVQIAKTLGYDMTMKTIQDAEAMQKRTNAFLENGLNAATLDPADPNAKTGIHPDSHANALGSARLGAVEAIREAADSVPVGGKGVAAHLGAHLSLVDTHQKYAAGKGIDKAVATSATNGAASLLANQVLQDQFEIDNVGGKMDSVGANEADQVRGRNLVRFANNVGDYARTKDLAALRKSTNEVVREARKSGDMKSIQAAAYAQALTAKTEANLAYKSAHDRYSADFIENLNGKFEEKMGGSKWAPIGMMAGNAGKELFDMVAMLKELSPAKAAFGPAAGIALVVIDGIFTVHDWWAKAKLNKAKSKMTNDFKSFMDKGEKTTLAKIQSEAEAEVKLASAGQARPVEGMRGYADKLALGQKADPPKAIELDDLSEEQLNEFYTEMLKNPGAPHTTLYGTYLASIGVKGNELWQRFEKEISDLPSVWK